MFAECSETFLHYKVASILFFQINCILKAAKDLFSSIENEKYEIYN